MYFVHQMRIELSLVCAGKGKDPKAKAQRDKGSAKGRPARRGSNSNITPPPGATTPQSEVDGSLLAGETALHDAKTPKLNYFRWMIPAGGEVIIKLRFTSEDLGQFDQTLNFEIVGTRRRYQLYCRGICAFPTISREPRIVFPTRQKSKKTDDIISKKYILSSETFEFGPLLVGKTRDRYASPARLARSTRPLDTPSRSPRPPSCPLTTLFPLALRWLF